ncbi:MAG TPA: endonuclease/exonuclease/phosphatase family protein [Longimicrobium sp.]|jgi:endonuclease/exonuclease/phosphatase family metal-dependent hydrolase|nr:endonuclease/exonuclease/phosphatase family protein [Longimicrobium sp.]
MPPPFRPAVRRVSAMTSLRRPWPVALVLAALLAGCAGLDPDGRGGRDVTVLVYNIHAGKDTARQNNLARVAELVRGTGADLVLLQEVDRNTERSGPQDQPAELARLTGYSVAFGRTISFQGGDYGIALLSRWPIQRDTLIPLTVTAPPGRTTEGREQRGVLLARIAAPGGPLAVLNTHLDHTGDDVWRVQEIAGVLRAAATVDARQVPVLVGGDLNAFPESPIHEQLRAAGFHDVWPECGAGDEATFPMGTPVRRIDYLYLAGAVRCVEARVLPSDASDHRPLLVRLRVR